MLGSVLEVSIEPNRHVKGDKPKVRPEINNLPRAESTQHTNRAESKPLNAVIRRLISISKPLLSMSEVLHLMDKLADQLLDSAQLNLDRLELLRRLDLAPVLGVGTDLDVQLDVPLVRAWPLLCAACQIPVFVWSRGGLTLDEHVLETDVEGGVGERGEGHALLAYDIFGACVVIAYCVLDL